MATLPAKYDIAPEPTTVTIHGPETTPLPPDPSDTDAAVEEAMSLACERERAEQLATQTKRLARSDLGYADARVWVAEQLEAMAAEQEGK